MIRDMPEFEKNVSQIGLAIVFVILGLSLACCGPSQKPVAPKNDKHAASAPIRPSMRVFPRVAEHLKPIELSDFVADIVPDAGFKEVGWDYKSDGPIEWITPGYSSGGGTETWRLGLVRIRVAGRSSTVLRQHKEELAWAISLMTEGNVHNGPNFIRIEPGFDNDPDLHLDLTASQQCFGAGFDGCNFTAPDILKNPRIKSKQMCEGKNGQPAVYEITVDRKSPILFTYDAEFGSGGESDTIELHPLGDQDDLCKKP